VWEAAGIFTEVCYVPHLLSQSRLAGRNPGRHEIELVKFESAFVTWSRIMMTDPIADMLTRMRNAIAARHERVQVPASRMKREIARILKEEGYIRDFSLQQEGHPQGLLDVELKYDVTHTNVIRGLQRISKPGKRRYVSSKEMPKVLEGAGVAIISTSRGILTDRQCRADNTGGEVLCFVW
jgi:small subunit ribosomal protein S8